MSRTIDIIKALLTACDQANWNMNATAAEQLTGILMRARHHVTKLEEEEEQSLEEMIDE